MTFGLRRCFAAMVFAGSCFVGTSGCNALLETISYRDASNGLTDGSVRDATGSDTSFVDVAAVDTGRDDSAPIDDEISVDASMPDTSEIDGSWGEAGTIDVIGPADTVVVDSAPTDVATDSVHHDAIVTDVGSQADSSTACASASYDCPSATTFTCDALTQAIGQASTAAGDATCCNLDTDCLLLSTDGCCGMNLAVSPSAASACVTTLLARYVATCQFACTAVLCTTYSVSCVNHTCVRAVGL